MAKNEEVPTSLKSKMSRIKEPSIVVQFAVDDKYSIIQMKKIEPFGNVELDKKRSKSDPRGYSIATTKSKPNKDSSSPSSILAGRNSREKAQELEDFPCSTMQLLQNPENEDASNDLLIGQKLQRSDWRRENGGRVYLFVHFPPFF